MEGPRADDKVGTMSVNPLHDARVQRGLSLTTIASTTRLSPWIVNALDGGRFDAIPAGIYARSYVRAFARAVGLDPEAALETLTDRLPPAVEVSAQLVEGSRPPAETWPFTPIVRAAIVDLAFLFSLSALLVAVVSEYCGLPSGALLRLEPGPIVGLCAPVWVVYEVLLGRLGAHRIFWSGSSFFIPWSIGILSLSGVRPSPIIRRLNSSFNSVSFPAAAESLIRFTRSAGSFFRS
jgi:hypothetical protein